MTDLRVLNKITKLLEVDIKYLISDTDQNISI